MLQLKKPEPAPFLNEFLTTMAQGGTLNYCGVCLRTENERRLVDHKALITFTACIALTKQWKNKFICYMCHRQALKALTFLRGVSFAGNMDTIFSDLLEQKKILKEDVFQNSIFHALLIKHGMGGLKCSPEGWETELRCIRRATTLKCRRTQVTGVGTGRPQQDRLSSGNLYLVHEESDDLSSDPDSELALASTSTTTITNHNQSTSASENTDPPSSNHKSRSLTPNQEEILTTDSENPDLKTSLNPGLSRQINQSFACRKGACWTRKRRPISAAELAAAKVPRVDLYESHYGRSTDEEISRTVRRLNTGQTRSNRGARRKSTLDEAEQSRSSTQSSSRTVLTTVDEAGSSRVEQAGPCRVEQAGPCRVEQAGPSRVERAGPNRVERTGPSRVERAGPSRVERAGPSRVERAGPSRVERAGPSRVEQAGPSRVEQAGPSRVEQAGPKRVEQAGPNRVEQAGPSRQEQAEPSQASEAGPSWASEAGPSWASEAGPSWASEPGRSRPYKAGPNWFYEAGPSWAYDVFGPNWASQAGPSCANKDRSTSTDKAGTSPMDQAGAGPISSKECRKDLGGTKRKGKRPVSKDHTTTDGPVDNIVIPAQPQNEKIVILNEGEEDNGIGLQIEKLVATDVKPDSILSSTPTLKRQHNEPVNRALEHQNAPSTSQKQIQVNTVCYVPENQPAMTDDSPVTQKNNNSNSPLTLPAPSQSKSGQSGPNRKRSLDGASMMATPSKRTVLPGRDGRRVDREDKIPAGVTSFKSAAGSRSNPQMPPPTSTYVIKTPASGRVQEPPRINTGRGDVLTSAQYSSTRNPSPQKTPATAQTSYVRTTPPNVRVQYHPRTYRGGREVFISAQAAVRINPDPHGPRTGRPAHGPLRRPRYVGRNQGQPAVQDIIRKYTMSNEDSN